MDSEKTIGVGMLGYAFMGRAHTNAFKKLPYFYYPPPAEPVLEGICGRNEPAVQEAAQRFGYRYATTDWKKLVDDPAIELFDNNGPNNVHKEPCIAALQAGKHTIVEKPLALDVDEARAMVEVAQAAEKQGIKNMVSFSNRFCPAVLLARRLIQEGKIGNIYHFRAAFLQDWLLDPNFPLAWRLKKEVAGSGVLGDLNAHSIDMARFLTGLEISEACGITETFIKERPVPLEASGLSGKGGEEKGAVTVDDASLGMFRFDNGALGSIEATRFATGRKSLWQIEVYGSRGALQFELTQNNLLQYFSVDDPLEVQGFRTILVTNLLQYFSVDDPLEVQGFRTILVTEAEVHDFVKHWWPPGHMLGWEHHHCHTIFHFFNCVANNLAVAPWGATFEDGLKVQLILDALQRSEKERSWVNVEQ
jgi:predicted dehydrogenase